MRRLGPRPSPLWLLLLPTLAACAHPAIRTAATVRPDCGLGLLSYSKADTGSTIREIKAYDAAWRAACDPDRTGAS